MSDAPPCPVADDGPAYRAPAEATALDLVALGRYLSGVGFALDRDQPARQFASGLANLNYLISVDGRPVVLRRPPSGDLPPGAHDMAREHRVLSRLGAAFPLAPESLHLCADRSILGVPFQLIAYRHGMVIKGDDRTRLDKRPEACARLGQALVATMAALHAVDPARIGLEDFGKPAGFTRRQIAGWKGRGERLAEGSTGLLVVETVAWLDRQTLVERAPVLLHCDLKIDNMILDPATLDPVAVVDWDMSTRGDPLFDLATTLSYWTEPGDPPVMHRMAQMPTAAPGFPLRAEAVAAYAAQTGANVSDLPVYRVLAMLKLAVVFLQLHALYRNGATADARYAGFGELAHDLLLFTRDIIAGKAQ